MASNRDSENQNDEPEVRTFRASRSDDVVATGIEATGIEALRRLPEEVRERFLAESRTASMDEMIRLTVWALSHHPGFKPGVTVGVEENPETGMTECVAVENGVKQTVLVVGNAATLAASAVDADGYEENEVN